MSGRTGADDLGAAHRRLRAAWERDGALSLDQRRAVLRTLRAILLRDAEAYVAAIAADFGIRSRHETLLTEVVLLLQAIDHALPHLAGWSAPSRVRLGLPFWPARGRIVRQPRGVVGIIGPSNYPLQLALMPVVGALAAGCRVLVKPSEMTPHTAVLLQETLGAAIDPEIVGVVRGGADVAAAMTRLPLGMLLFTGSQRVGRKVMAAAAETLTPVILELGGKSPAIVDEGADVKAAAISIIAGKLLNAGQTCIAPDYLLVPRRRLDGMVAALREAAAALYPDTRDYTAVASPAAFQRLQALEVGQQTIPLLPYAVAPPLYPPTLVLAPPLDSAIMTEEIFGPILPILGYETLDEAIAIIAGRPDPLTLYWFGADRGRLDRLLARTTSGSVCVNETIIHAGVPALPFGGIGASGMGRYHGKAGFDAFTHERVVFHQARYTLTKLMRPPFGRRAESILARLLR